MQLPNKPVKFARNTRPTSNGEAPLLAAYPRLDVRFGSEAAIAPIFFRPESTLTADKW